MGQDVKIFKWADRETKNKETSTHKQKKKEQRSDKWITALIELIIMTHLAFLESTAKELPFPSSGNVHPSPSIRSAGQYIFRTNFNKSINNTCKKADEVFWGVEKFRIEQESWCRSLQAWNKSEV